MKKLMIMLAASVLAGVVHAGLICVDGEAMAFYRPDMVTMGFGLTTDADPSIRESLKKITALSEKASEVLNEFCNEGEVSFSDVRMSSESHYELPNGERYMGDSWGRPSNAVQIFDGYTHTINVTIEIPLDMSRLEKIYMALLDAELMKTCAVSFYLADSKTAKDEIRAQAIANAKEVAEKSCAAAGVKLGRISKMSISARTYDHRLNTASEVYGCAMSDSDDKHVMPKIEVAGVPVEDKVSIDWEIE